MTKKATPKLSVHRPTSRSSARPAASRLEERDTRIVLRLSEEAHLNVKRYALEKRTTVKDLVLSLLEKEGIDVRC